MIERANSVSAYSSLIESLSGKEFLPGTLCIVGSGILPDQHEIPVIRDQDQPVFPPIFRYLLPRGGDPGVVLGGFDLDDAPRFAS